MRYHWKRQSFGWPAFVAMDNYQTQQSVDLRILNGIPTTLSQDIVACTVLTWALYVVWRLTNQGRLSGNWFHFLGL